MQHRAEPSAPTEVSGRARRVLVGLMVADVQIGVVVDAVAPVAMHVSALVDLVNVRLGEIGHPRLTAAGRGRWALCWVDGTALRPNRSLSDQGVIDGSRLWLQFVDDTESRAAVIEHVTSAVPAELNKHWPGVDALWAARVGVGMVAGTVAMVLAVLTRWRYGHDGWLASAIVGGLAVVLLVGASVVAMDSSAIRRVVGDVLLLVGAATLSVAAALAVPGPLGAPHATMGAAVVVAAGALIVRFTGRHVSLCTTAMVLGVAALISGGARMLLLTSAVALLTCVLLMAIVGIKLAPSLARRAADIRLPVFPSASGRWIFETRPDLPSAVVVAGGDDPQLEGPESVRDVAVATDRAHSYLTGLLAGLCSLLVISCAGLCDPRTHQRWLPLLLTGAVAAWVVLHGRSYTDRWQATVLALTSVAIVTAVTVRYAVVLTSVPALLVACAVMMVVPTAGLIAAVVVPHNVYTPVFRQIVEWSEYVLLVAMFPLAFWLMDVFAAIRYR